MPLGQRVVLVGGGHNALIAAFYLAKGGFKPLVLERRETVGGGAITEEFYSGFRASILARSSIISSSVSMIASRDASTSSRA